MSTIEQTVRPKRMTLSEIVELLLARSASDRTSVSLSRNAKGDTQIEVVVRTSDGGDVATADQAAAKAQELYERFRNRYPMSDGKTGAAPTKPEKVAKSDAK